MAAGGQSDERATVEPCGCTRSHVPSEREEWRTVACPLALLLCAFGVGWLYTARVTGIALGWPVVIAYGIAFGWLARALIGWRRGNACPMDMRALENFRHRHFWSRTARWSYAALLVCDGLFLLDVNPAAPALFFVLAALSGVFAPEVGVLSVVLGATQLF